MYTNPAQWRRLRKRVLVDGESIRSVAKREGMSRNTLRKILSHETPPRYIRRASHAETKPAAISSKQTTTKNERRRWMEWIFQLERGDFADEPLGSELAGLGLHARKLVLAVMARDRGFSCRAIADHLGLARQTVRIRFAAYDTAGLSALLGRKRKQRKMDDEAFTTALFNLLHEPPSLSGYNRTTWKMADLQEALAKRGMAVCKDVIRQAIQKAGFRWRSAKVVLTSTDPQYREKLARVQMVLSNLRENERFFSIDEYGPFAVKAKSGRVLAGPGDNPSVPQWQKSKGWLIVTAALELSRNRITHFYSRTKNTAEMIKLARRLLEEYPATQTLYLSWDAASWHVSKKLCTFIDVHNANHGSLPRIELVPLPASAQFLNVIESVFSGMARAIIHSSDYPSVDAAKEAIDRYFEERNRHFEENPKRAGARIWGKERTTASFSAGNNCKDKAYR